MYKENAGKGNRMLVGQRQDEIIRIVEKKGSVTLKELVEELHTSESTIRRDLTELDQRGALRKVFGGAIAIGSRRNVTEESVARRMEVFAEEKKQIGRCAAALIEPNDFVFIDGGTTTGAMIPFISEYSAIYVTNAVSHALELIRRYWGGMLDCGATSFWEDFDLDWTVDAGRIDELPVPGKKDIHADFGAYCYKGLRHSLSHGWSCGPAPFLSERVLGVRFLAPGGRCVSVRPDLGDLGYVRGRVPTPYGLITVEAESSGKVKVSLPDGVTAQT